MMGPSPDGSGFEQGGINSGDYYKLYNNVQLNDAQDSELGVDIGSSTISAVGQADDVILVANDLNDLRLLVTLTAPSTESNLNQQKQNFLPFIINVMHYRSSMLSAPTPSLSTMSQSSYHKKLSM